MALKTLISLSALTLLAVSTAQASPESKPGTGPDSVSATAVELAAGRVTGASMQPDARLGPERHDTNSVAFLFPGDFAGDLALRPESRPGQGPGSTTRAGAPAAERGNIAGSPSMRPASRPGNGPDEIARRTGFDTEGQGSAERVALQPESRPGLAPATRSERPAISATNPERISDDHRHSPRPASRTAALERASVENIA